MTLGNQLVCLYLLYQVNSCFPALVSPGIVREKAHKSDSKLRSISTTRLTPQHHLWYTPLSASAHREGEKKNIYGRRARKWQTFRERCGLKSVVCI